MVERFVRSVSSVPFARYVLVVDAIRYRAVLFANGVGFPFRN